MFGMRCRRRSAADASASVHKNHTERTAASAGIVEHVFHPLGHGGQYGVTEQGVQASQQQGAKHHGNQDFHGGVDLTLAAGLPHGGAA